MVPSTSKMPPPQARAHTWCLGLLCLSLAVCVPAAPLDAPTDDPLCGPDAPQHSTERLLQRITLCQHNPDWLAHLGQRLNTEARYAEAAEHLERALLLHPTHLGASFAYSVALAGSGDLASAVELLAQLSTRPDVPAAQRRQLIAAQMRMAEQPLSRLALTAAPAWVARTSVAWRVGHDNNLLGSPRLNSLTLTLPTGDQTYAVDPVNQPRAGHYQRVDARLDVSHHPSGPRRTDVALALQERRNASTPESNNQQIEALIESLPAQQGIWGNLSLAALRTDGGTRYHSTSLGSGWAWHVTPECQTRLGAESQTRQLASNPVLSGRYTGVLWTWNCAPTSATHTSRLPVQWWWSLRTGTDHPTQPTRPGGIQHTTALRASARWAQWQAEAELTHSQDRTGYSPLLDNNRLRHSTRTLVRVEYHWPLAPLFPALQGAFATTGIEGYVQQSNIRLFKVRSYNTYFSLRYQW